jgi:hypothetical protein
MQVTASHERPERTTHAEFVEGYRGGRIALTWADGLPAYTFAAWGRWFIGYLRLLVGLRSVFVLFVILTFVLRDPLLLLGIPAAYLGTVAGAPGGAPGNDARKSPARVFMTAAAFLGLFFGLFSDQGWRSAVFLISCGLLFSFAVNLTYNAISQRAFVRLLLTEKEFYEAALERNVITLRTQC